MEKKIKHFRTGDIYLSAYLVARGLPVDLIKIRTKVLFLFPSCEETYKLVAAFNESPLPGYIDTLKELRERMYGAKEAS
jgi:hypothetical protein